MTIRSTKVLMGIALVMAISNLARAETITFDDVAGFETRLTDGYAGLIWNNFSTVNGYMFCQEESSGYCNGLTSGTNTAFNVFGGPASFSDPGGFFTFNSIDLTAAWNDGLKIEMQGLSGGHLLYDSTLLVNTTGPTLVNLNWGGVDTVNFASSGGSRHWSDGGGTEFAMDTISLTRYLPEWTPGAHWYMPGFGWTLGFAGGFGGLIVIRRKYSTSR